MRRDTTGKVYNNNHFDIDGYWYRKEGKEYVKTDSKYDEYGLDIDRRDKNEFTKNGYFKNTRKKYNSDGFMKDEVHSITNQKYDLSGKTLAPFTTNEGSGFGDSLTNIQKAAPKAKLADGLQIRGKQVESSIGEIKAWVDGIKAGK